MKIFLIITLSTLLAGCSAYIQRNEMSGGEQLYRSRCSACHMLIDKNSLLADEWESAVRRYGAKLKEEEKKKILDYLRGSQ